MNTSYLYRFRPSERSMETILHVVDENAAIFEFRPMLFKLTYGNEVVSLKILLSRLYFLFITRGRFRIFYLCVGSEVAHYSYVVPQCVKFPFLAQNDWEIGPCVTMPQFRRKGYYHLMLSYITSLPIYAGSDFYMIVNCKNTPSIGGIEKAGFERIGSVRKTIFKNYVVESPEHE